jgi:FMN phosphatase YigB (HAD superfamily)
MRYKYIFFDVAGTLLYKDGLYEEIAKTLKESGIEVSQEILRQRHTIVSDIILSPTKTSKIFYDYFNREFLYSMGVVPKREIVDRIYERCKGLPWKKFNDTKALENLPVDLGIITNWDSSLRGIIKKEFDIKFTQIVLSSEVGISKPNIELFQKALSFISLPADKVLYVGNSIKLDLEPALKVGFHAVVVDRDSFYPPLESMRIKSLYEINRLLT